MALLNTAVFISKCLKTNKSFGTRIEEIEGDWYCTWAFPVDDQVASKEGYDKQNMQGQLLFSKEYNGCPHCESSGWIRCGGCGKFSCYDNNEVVTCPWCQRENKVSAAKGKIDISGGGF